MGGRERQRAKEKDVEKGRRVVCVEVVVEHPVFDHICDYTFSGSAVEIFHTYTHITHETHTPTYTNIH